MANTVDVLIPHFNDIEGLRKSLNSLRDQEWRGGIRAVVYDDGSMKSVVDQLSDLCDSFDFQIDLIKGRVNKGRPFSRNRLLDAVEGKYVTWLDSGDVWYPDKLKIQMNFLYWMKFRKQDTDSILITCNYDWVLPNKKPRLCEQKTHQDQVKALLIGRTLRAYLWTLFGEANVFKQIGYFDERLQRMQDLDYFLRFCSIGGKLASPKENRALCAYFKEYTNRDPDQIKECTDIVHSKYRNLIVGYGEAFAKNRNYDANIMAARFSRNNKMVMKNLSYLVNAFACRPTRFLKEKFEGKI